MFRSSIHKLKALFEFPDSLNMDKCIELLCSHQKLERDRGVDSLEQLLPSIANADAVIQVNHRLTELLSEPESKSWETMHGGLLALKCIYEKGNYSGDVLQSCIKEINNACLELLRHDEARVRLAAGKPKCFSKLWIDESYLDNLKE